MIKKIGRFIKKNFLLLLSAPLVLIILFTAIVKCSALDNSDYQITLTEQPGPVAPRSSVTWGSSTPRPLNVGDPVYNSEEVVNSPSLSSFLVQYIIPIDFIHVSIDVNDPETDYFGPARYEDLANIRNYLVNNFVGRQIPGISVGRGLPYKLDAVYAFPYYNFYSNFQSTDEYGNFVLNTDYWYELYPVECQNGCLSMNLIIPLSCSPVLDIPIFNDYSIHSKRFYCGDWFNISSGEFVNLYFSENTSFGSGSSFRIETENFENGAICYMRVYTVDLSAPANLPIYSSNFQNKLYGRFVNSFDNYISSCVYCTGLTGYNTDSINKGSLRFDFGPLGYNTASISANRFQIGRTSQNVFWSWFEVSGGSYDFTFSGLRSSLNYTVTTSNTPVFVACSINKGVSAITFPENLDIKLTAFAWVFTDPSQTSFGVGSGTDTGYNFKDLYKTIDYDFKRDGLGPVFTRVLPYSLYNFCIWFVLESPLISDIIKPIFSVVNVTSTFARDYLLPIFTALGVFGGLLALVLVISVIVKRLQ